MKHVVIVESPAKCKTIAKYLGKDYVVLASFGHIRDVPSQDGMVQPDNDFAITYQISKDSTKHIKAISDAVKKADSLILATDPDREGEAISWHVLEVLKQKKAIKASTEVSRVSFTSITKEAVQQAMQSPRQIDMDMVNAQQARRALDYLVGFTLSPVLWRKLPGSKSAGRVQSVALRLVADREHEIEQFDPQEYWRITAQFKADGKMFEAQLVEAEGKKLPKMGIKNEADATRILAGLEGANFSVAEVEKKQSRRNPPPPFTTSTLQQEASRKLGFNAKRTMMTAQKLYEGIQIGGETTGVITYMRTDAVHLAPEAIGQARDVIAKQFTPQHLPEAGRQYKGKNKNAQEAHEAIRPTDPRRTPASLAQYLNDDQRKLYELIWKRMIASQMTPVVLDQVAASIIADDRPGTFRATGSTVAFDGFYAVYKEGADDVADDAQKDEEILPPLKQGMNLPLASTKDKNPLPTQHFTKPPPRYTEASLVKKLEELGIGRPSTYAAIISVLQERDYVRLENKRFVPESRGRLVTAFLASYFPRYVEYDFTATLENKLDDIADGKLNWTEALRAFWQPFNANVGEAMELKIADVIDALQVELDEFLFPGEGESDARRTCNKCNEGKMGLRLGKFGAFLGCSNYPDCNNTTQLDGSAASNDNGGAGGDGQEYPRELGHHPEHKVPVSLRKGPYGVYVQLDEEGVKKPKRQGLPKGMSPADVTLEVAVNLLSLPREVGEHPETGKMITASIGRYGPYIAHDGAFVSLKGDDDVLTIGMNRAVDLIASNPKKGGGATAEPLKELGNHPKTGKPIVVLKGRYGPYFKFGKKNISVPKKVELDDFTLDDALKLIEAKKKK